MRTATTESKEVLVSKALHRDRVDGFFRDAVKKARRTLKRAPGGTREWIWYQCSHGAYNPQRAILEMLDLLIDADAPEEDVEGIAQFFVSYVNGRYASKETKAPTVREALRLKLHADAEAEKADVDATIDPTLGNLERVCDTTQREVSAETTLLSVCRDSLAAHLRISR